MDDETADVELLERHLGRSAQLSLKMTSVLQKFDHRLQKLEKSILPLHKSTQSLIRLADNIDGTLLQLDKIASSKPQALVDETLILRGPRESELYVYTDALKGLNAGLAFGESDQFTSQTTRLAETGAKKIAQLFTKLVAEASSSGPIDPAPYLDSAVSSFPLFSSELEDSLSPVVLALRALPLPATHPSHPAASSNLAILQEAQNGYSNMRSGWMKRCLEPTSRSLVVEADNERLGVQGGRNVSQWVEGLLYLAEAEYEVLPRLAPLPTPAILTNTFSDLTNPLITLFNSTLSTLQSIVRRSLKRYLYLAFSTYIELSALQDRWDEIMRLRAGRKQNDLSDFLHSLRAVCLRIFPEVIADIKLAGNVLTPAGGKPVEVGSGLAPITTSIVDFLERLPPVQEGILTALRVLGDGNWNMGAASGNMRKVGEDSETDDRGLLEHFTHDVISNLLTTITTLTKTQKRLPLASIFLINNISFLRLRLLFSPEAPIDEMLSSQTQSLLNATFRSAKATYLESNFTALVSCLSEDKAQSGLGNNKQSTKEKALRFFDCLEELLERHRFAKVLEDDEEARSKLGEDVVQLVVPILSSFLAKHREKEFSKNPAKYIKFNPDEVERQLRSCY